MGKTEDKAPLDGLRVCSTCAFNATAPYLIPCVNCSGHAQWVKKED